MAANRPIRLVLLALALATVPGCKRSPGKPASSPATQPDAQLVPHRSADGRVTIATPPGWTEQPSPGADLTLVGPPGPGKLTPTVRFSTTSQAAPVQLDRYVADVLRGLAGGLLSDYEIASFDSHAALAGLPATRIVYTGRLRGTSLPTTRQAGAPKLLWRQTFAAKGNVVYVLTCLCDAEQADACRPGFEQIEQNVSLGAPGQ